MIAALVLDGQRLAYSAEIAPAGRANTSRGLWPISIFCRLAVGIGHRGTS